ncbi:Methylpurine-DNA glycosylase (MPG) [Popillia japonica]|uniref:DNA-3-methyladenine glycosylase n=1 Tax=Popillia japonica TaxID=7064 RepID=A0AAW1M5R5_POPJA
MSCLKRKLDLAINANKKRTDDNIKIVSELHLTRLGREHFNISCDKLAKFLLGKVLVHQVENVVLKGRIIETECYLGGDDKASHSYNGRRTAANEAMYMEPGTAYVYKIYGIYHCFNVSSIESGGAVLVRALEPIKGIDKMQEYRNVSRMKIIKTHELCKGPSKLCISMNITKENSNKVDMCKNNNLWIEADDYSNSFQIVNTARIGIGSTAEEWLHTPLRFYIKDNIHVSKRDREKEEELSVVN